MLVTPLRTLAVLLVLSIRPGVAQDEPSPFHPRVVAELDFAPMTAWAPKWSPDGKWIAFSLARSEGIAVVKPDGAGLRVLTGEPRSGYRFAWSPDSAQIAYRAAIPEAGPRRYVIRTIDLEANRSAPGEVIADAQPPQWQSGPAGMRWVSHDGVRPLEGAWRADRRPQRPADISPPLVATRDRQLWLEDANPGKRRKLSALTGIRPVWNATGRELLFDAEDRIHLASIDDPAPARELCAGQHPAWAPNGEWIVYQITRDHSHAPEDGRQHTPDTLPHRHDDKTNHQIADSDLWVIRRDGKERHQLTRTADVLEADPDWSSDGRLIVCRDERSGRLRILQVDPP